MGLVSLFNEVEKEEFLSYGRDFADYIKMASLKNHWYQWLTYGA